MKYLPLLILFLLLTTGVMAAGTFKYTSTQGRLDAYKDFNGSDFCLIDGSNCAVGNSTGSPGANGTGVLNASILANGSLTIGLTNGTLYILSNVTGATGPQGATGANGANGTNGADGVNGTNGVNGTGVLNATVLSNGSLSLGLTNGTTLILGNVTGSPGATGATGVAGTNGSNGSFVNGSDAIIRNLTVTNHTWMNVTYIDDLTLGNNLEVIDGGTGLGGAQTGGLMVGTSPTALSFVAPVVAGYPLVSQGSSAVPAYDGLSPLGLKNTTGVFTVDVWGMNCTGSCYVKNTTGDVFVSFDGVNRRVGIGTSSSSYPLEIQGGGSNIPLYIYSTGSTGAVRVDGTGTVGIQLLTTQSTGCRLDLNTNGARGLFKTYSGCADFIWRNESNVDQMIVSTGSKQYSLVVNAQGVGINTNTPNNALNVVGDLNISGASYGLPQRYMLLAEAYTDTNAPLAEQALGNNYFQTIVNMSQFKRFQYGVSRGNVAGAAAYEIHVKYKASTCGTLTASTWTNLSTTNSNLAMSAQQQGSVISSWESLPSLSGNYCVGFFTSGGDGAFDPQFRNMWVEFS